MDPHAKRDGDSHADILVAAIQDLSGARTLEEIQRIVRHAARKLTGADGATFVLRDGDQCFYADEDAIAPLWKGLRFPMSACISGWVMLNKQPAVIEDIYADDRIPADAYRPTFVKSLAMVPIRTSEPIGAIGNYWATHQRPTNDEVRRLQLLANSTSIAIENEGLYRALEERVRERTAALETARSAEAAVRRELEERERAERELHRTEEQLRQAQKMDAIGRLAGGIAHDFNNVLSVILSTSELAMADLKDGDPLREDLGEIRRAGERAAALTRQLLLFSRQQAVEPKPQDLNQIVRGMETMLGRLIGESIELEVRPAVPLDKVMADSGQLEQVVLNLVVNARDAMPHGGKLTIETKNVVLDDEYVLAHHGVAAGEYVMVAVTDTGTGMSPDVQARIFEPFYTTKEEGQGTGLGLSTVYGIVRRSEGHVWAYSELGQGTTLKVYLPRHAEAEEAPAARPPVIQRLTGSETILLVEDDDQVRSVARGILRRNGYNVLESRNPGEALLTCEQYPQRIHLLLTDVVMAQMSGVKLAQRLTQVRRDMRVVCMSGYTDEAVRRHGIIDSGAAAFVQKPFTPEVLLREVRRVLDVEVV